MQVSDGMSSVVLTVGPGHTLREAARAMTERKVGAAVVMDPDQPGPGIVTERDLLESIGAGQSPDQERVSAHLSTNLTFAAPDWSVRISFANLDDHGIEVSAARSVHERSDFAARAHACMKRIRPKRANR